MYVEEVILEGFKTYMNRTVVSSFDPQFNAITGFNGSGKSNILDAIQFLLGSTSKQMLRLKTGLTQLIYKQGFAGIQKASVTIKFQCPDKNMRPTGYQNSQQLIVTRQITKDKITKFFVNGQNSNLTKVKNMFRSVQLNIQNPHFLVKQGQITKIINLKPLQLLGMIQQTAGTAYYNKTRTQSQKIIERKQQKLKSINEIMQSTIRPQMQKLQVDRKKYAAFKDKQVLAERLNHKLKKHLYTAKILQARNMEYKLSTYKQQIQRNQSQLRNYTQRLVEIQNQIKILKNQGDNSFMKDYNNMKNLLLQNENKRRTIKNRLKIIQQNSLRTKQQTIKGQQQLKRYKEEIQWYEKQSIETEKQIQHLGDLLTDLNKARSQQQTLKLIQKQISQQYSQINNLKQQIKILTNKKQSIINDSQAHNKSILQTQQSMNSIVKTIQSLQKQIQHFKKIQKPISVQDPQLGAQQLRRLQNQRKKLTSGDYRLSFYFNDPHPGFNRSQVKGRMYMIFTPKQRIHQKALQIGIGPKISNIIVQNQIASQALVKAESFGQTSTFIPNNKIKYTNIKPQILKYAAQVAQAHNGLAKVAYQLVDFNPQLRNTIYYAFGNFIVCSSSQIAKKIVYSSNKSMQCKCVTYDGDIYEPGTLTGGSDSNQPFILPKYHQIRQIDQKIRIQRAQFDKNNKHFHQNHSKLNEYRLLEKQIEAKINRKQKLQQKRSNMTVNAKPRDYSEQLAGIDKRVQNLTKQIAEHQNKVKEMSSKLKSGSLKSIQEQKKTFLNDQKKCQRKLSEAKKKISMNQLQIQRLNNNLQANVQNQIQYQKEISQLQNQQSKLLYEIKQNRSTFQTIEQKKNQYQKQMTVNQNQIQILTQERQQIKRKEEKASDQIKNMKEELDGMGAKKQHTERIISTILMENQWLQNQRTIQIQPDFNYEATKRQYQQILIDIDKLKKTVKVNVDDHSYQKLNEQYKNLLDKKSILQNDKKTLLSNMHQLDDKRTKTLQSCFKVVKDNLGQIFNDLLPGATAHLNLIDQQDVTKGAELRVHFNNIKKQLSQLSGGQRSLLALSFILALLLYKPSPFYILDQIDSALDLSHTQNIGYMISKRFPQSQFIIISLKEGMFQNANVLYRVHFAQGESKVDRQMLKKKK